MRAAPEPPCARRGRHDGDYATDALALQSAVGTKLSPTVIPLIMCGGAGTRLWPASREGRPKQFLSLFGAHSTFQDTVRRVTDPLFGRPIVVTNNQYRFLVAEQLAAIGTEADILLEPVRRDSGPAIAAGAAFAAKRDENTLLVALAAEKRHL